MSRECMFLGSLSRHNKDLERWTLKPSARHGSRVLDKPCCSSWANQCCSSVFIYNIAGESKTRRKESGGVRGEGERERKRERVHVCTRERESKRKRFGSSFYMFFSPTWACPMQIGLSQECCLFCLKFSLWSSDLPLTFLVF